MAKLYERVLPRLGREIRPPLTYEDLAFSAMALLDGFLLHFPSMGHVITRRHRWGSDHGDAAEPGQWTLFAIGIEGVILNATRPLSGGPQLEDPV